MDLLVAPSKAAQQIIRALNLPPNTVGFTLRMRAGEVATLEIETYCNSESAEPLATVLKQYHLQAIEEPNGPGELPASGGSARPGC